LRCDPWRLDEQVFVAIHVLDRRNSGGWGDRRVADEMAHVEPKQGTRYVGDDDLGIADRQYIMATEIARGAQQATVEADSSVTNGMDDPYAFSPFDSKGGSRICARKDDVGTLHIVGSLATNRGRLAKSTIANRLPNTYLCVGARTRQRPVGHFSACGRTVLSLGLSQLKLVPSR
jgi:hypothetical protein